MSTRGETMFLSAVSEKNHFRRASDFTTVGVFTSCSMAAMNSGTVSQVQDQPSGAIKADHQAHNITTAVTMPAPLFTGIRDFDQFASSIDWQAHPRKPSAARDLPTGNRFILGADNDDDEYNEEDMMYNYDRNNEVTDDVLGSSPDSWIEYVSNGRERHLDAHGAPKERTSFEFSMDDDSGLGISAPGTDDEVCGAERDEQPTELIPLRGINIGSKTESVRHSARKSKKLRFHDFYHLADDHLGAGAYACVRTAISISTGREYAVKLVDKQQPGHTRSRIIREVEIFKMCKNHPNVVQLIEWFEDDDFYYMVFEKMRGGQLLSRIQRKVCFTEQEAGMVTRDIASALKYLHDRGVAHRDVKPENILCTDFDSISPVKLCDLDLASKPSHPNRHSLPEVHSEPDLASPVGSAEFMAPEVVDAFVGESLKYDKRCDMWSLGVIIYIMLCGYPPFTTDPYAADDEHLNENCGWDEGQHCEHCQTALFRQIQKGDFDFPEEEWAQISEQAKDLIRHLLVRDVSQRYSADEVLKHAWVVHTAPTSNNVLQTATNLLRNESQRDVQQMNEIFNNHRMREGFMPSIDSNEMVRSAENQCVDGWKALYVKE